MTDGAPPPLRCPTCDAPTRELIELVRVGDQVVYGCAACIARARRAAAELARDPRMRALERW